jgi:G:T-mismatch repair DNA endonuclease (very short patch repair protein)
MTDTVSAEVRSRTMLKIRSRNTKPELAYLRNHRVRAYQPNLPFRPDFINGRGEIVFIDTGFWHCDLPQEKYECLPGFWKEKLFRNLVREMCAIGFYAAASIPFQRVFVS